MACHISSQLMNIFILLPKIMDLGELFQQVKQVAARRHHCLGGAGVGVITGFLLGFVGNRLLRILSLRRGHTLLGRESNDSDDDDVVFNSSDVLEQSFEESKLVLCVRTDLKMQKGKIAAQVGHATLGAYKKALRRNALALRLWENNAQPKIALQIKSEHEANQLERNAEQIGLVTYKVHDAGRTQIAAVCIRCA